MNKHHSYCLTNDLIKVAGIPKRQASVICEEAHKHYSPTKLASMPLNTIVHIFGGMAQAQVEPQMNLQRTWAQEQIYSKDGFQDNSQNSKGPDGKGVVPDKAYPDSSYGTDMQSCLDSLSSLNISPETAREECEKQYGGKGTISGQKHARLLNASKKICSDTKNYYSNVCKNGKTVSASVEQEPEAAAWAILHYRGELPRSTNNHSRQIKSAKEERDEIIYNYTTYRNMTHADNLIRNAEIEKMIEERANELEQLEENRRLKQAKAENKEVIEEPSWYVLHSGKY